MDHTLTTPGVMMMKMETTTGTSTITKGAVQASQNSGSKMHIPGSKPVYLPSKKLQWKIHDW